MFVRMRLDFLFWTSLAIVFGGEGLLIQSNQFLRADEPLVVSHGDIETEQLGAAGVSYIDPEILQSENLMVYQVAGDVWLAELNPTTGVFEKPQGNDLLIDQQIAPLNFSKNGPEFGISREGWRVYYNKELGGDIQIYRASVNENQVGVEALTDGEIDRINQLPSQNPNASAVGLVYGRGQFTSGPDNEQPDNFVAPTGPNFSSVAWLQDNEPEVEFLLTPLVPNVAGFRWAAGTSLATTTVGNQGEDFGQILLLDAETGNTRVITNDEGVKFDPYGWRAPEFSGELLVLAALENSCIGIYRDTGKQYWERIIEIETPPESKLDFIQSSEPFVAAGRSYISTTVKRENEPIFTGVTESEIWVYGIEPDIESRLYLRCDNGQPGLVRHEAETFLGTDEVFLYYNKINPNNGLIELYLCRTRIPSVLLGDVNRDGAVDLLDVSPFIDLLSVTNFQNEADINRDGVVNLLDVASFVKLLAS